MAIPVKALMEAKDLDGLRQILAENPALANEGLPYDEVNTVKAHPLHRICDLVMSKKMTDDEAVQMAVIFLNAGADVNGGELVEKKDTPLLAAASLHADEVAILYIDCGAELNHPGCYGGTALHWAAWCGRPRVVEKLILSEADIHIKSIDYQGTPLSWAIHGLEKADRKALPDHALCVKLLLKAGADKNIPDSERQIIADVLGNGDMELKALMV